VATSNQPLPVIPLPGLRLEVLGNYLASLGLLRVLARKWPSVRIAWRDEVLQVVGGPKDLDELLDALVAIAANREWTPYQRSWYNEQKEAKKTGRPLALWQAEADENTLELFAAHVVPLDRVAFNPLLGWGGYAGQRVFAKGWEAVVDELRKASRNVDRRRELQSWLRGEPVEGLMSGIAAASWFSNANKLYNSGQSAYREEPLSPWAMALACEGLPFLAGGASRRLGARARAQAAFPFVCQAAAPTTAGEAGRDRGEVWAPIWERPMTLPEVRALFQRGRAGVRGRGATTPAAFAAAIVRRGVDGGVSGFARFALGATTGEHTFEPRYQGIVPVPSGGRHSADNQAKSQTFERILALVERLPKDRKVGKSWWWFIGLRGPVEAALIRAAQAPNDAATLCELLDAVVSALDRVDRNVRHRKASVRWQPLPLEALPLLFGGSVPELEARLAMGLVSAFPARRPFAVYRFGVVDRSGRFEHPETPPARWVYRAGPLSRVLADVLLRSVLDWQKDATPAMSVSGIALRQNPLTASAADVERWLAGDVDESLLARWLGRLALFDWERVPDNLRSLWKRQSNGRCCAEGLLLLVGLLQPLFDARPLRLAVEPDRGDVLSEESDARTPGAARSIATLIRTGRLDAAIGVARSRYAMADARLMCVDVNWQASDPERLLAGLLFPITEPERTDLVGRWLRPYRRKGEYAHA
jgi:CRISPR-associated protein Csx17